MLFLTNIEYLKKLKISYLLEKTLVLSITCSNRKNENKKMFQEEQSIEIVEILGLINNIEEYRKI